VGKMEERTLGLGKEDLLCELRWADDVKKKEEDGRVVLWRREQ